MHVCLYYLKKYYATLCSCFASRLQTLIHHRFIEHSTHCVITLVYALTKHVKKMQPWVDSHMDWVKTVTEYLLKIKKQSLENILLEWLHGSFPLDEAGILIIACAYKIHVAVFFNDSYWTTMAKTDLNKCKVFLLYRGSLVFEDSRRVTVADYTEHRCLYSQLDKYYKKLEKDSEKQKEKEQQKQCAIKQSRNHISLDSESESTESSDRNIMPSTCTTVNASKEKESNIMPSENNSDTSEGAHAAAADVDLEKNDGGWGHRWLKSNERQFKTIKQFMQLRFRFFKQ